MQYYIGRFIVFLMFAFTAVTSAENVSSILDFFTAPNMVMAKISPNGDTVAVLKLVDEKQQLVAVNTKTNTQTTLIDLKDFSKGKSSVTALLWLDDDHIAAQLEENKKGIEELLNTKKSRRLVIIKRSKKNTLDKIYSVKTKGWLVHALPEKNNEFLYAKSGIYSKVYSIKINKLNEEGKKLSKLSRVDGGQFKKSNEVAEISGFATRWFFNNEGIPKASLHYNEEQELQLSAIDGGSNAEVLHSWPKEEEEDENNKDKELVKQLVPIAITKNENVFYCLDVNELEARSVYKVDFRTGQEELVYESNSFKIIDIELSANTEKISSVKAVNNGRVETLFVEDSEQLQNSTASRNKHFDAEISKSLDGAISVRYKESHTEPGSFYIIHQSSGKTTLLGERFPHLGSHLKSQLIESSLEVEGIQIPYLLSIPKLNKKHYPLIVMPHGGPIGPYDAPYYDPIVQNFNANGFAVLRVNFRGSGGYSKELKDSGKKQFGKLMLEDIHQATLNVVKRSDIKPQQVCIFGMSYGGYAAMMLATKHPNVYKCAASWAGVADINLYLNNSRHSKKQRQWANEHIGNPEGEYSSFKQESPVYNTKALQVPLLVAHGRKDTVVDVEHAFRMKTMLEKYQKQYQWYLDDDANHSFGELKNKKVFFDSLLAFITEHIQ